LAEHNISLYIERSQYLLSSLHLHKYVCNGIY